MTEMIEAKSLSKILEHLIKNYKYEAWNFYVKSLKLWFIYQKYIILCFIKFYKK